MYTITAADITANVLAEGPTGPVICSVRLIWHRDAPPEFIARAMVEAGGLDYTVREWASRPAGPKFIAIEPIDDAPIRGFLESGAVEIQRAAVAVEVRAARKLARKLAARARARAHGRK